jgi:hypothetical protein
VGVGVGLCFRCGVGVGFMVVVGGLKRLLSLNARPTIVNRQATKTPRTMLRLPGFGIGFSFFHPNPRAPRFLHQLEPNSIHPKCMSTLIRSTMTLLNVPYWTSDNGITMLGSPRLLMPVISTEAEGAKRPKRSGEIPKVCRTTRLIQGVSTRTLSIEGPKQWVLPRIVWHRNGVANARAFRAMGWRHSCLCQCVLPGDASTGKSAGATQASSFGLSTCRNRSDGSR